MKAFCGRITCDSSSSSSCTMAPNTYACIGKASNITHTRGYSMGRPYTLPRVGLVRQRPRQHLQQPPPALKRVARSVGGVVTTPLPTQAGIVANCVRFYFVQSGNGCWQIAIDVGLDLS